MKRNRRRLPVPQHEFGFAPDTFNLIQETGLDGERIAREREEVNAPATWRRKRNPSFSPRPHSASHEYNPESSRIGRACEAVQIQRAALRIQGRALARMPDARSLQLCDTPEHAADYWRLNVTSNPYFNPECECFAALLLNTRRRVKGHQIVSIGTHDTILVHPLTVFRLAIVTSAAALVLMHNHPVAKAPFRGRHQSDPRPDPRWPTA